MLRHDDHESWLDDHASDWGSENPSTLGDRLAEQLPETAVDGQTGDDAAEPPHSPSYETVGYDQARSLNPVDRAVLRDARELTRQMFVDEPAAPTSEDAAPTSEDTAPAGDPTGSTDSASPPRSDGGGDGKDS
jgi:hypothetical protein